MARLALAAPPRARARAEDLGRASSRSTEAERRGLALAARAAAASAVTPYYASLIDPATPPVRSGCRRSRRAAEAERAPGDLARPDRRGGAPARARDRAQVPRPRPLPRDRSLRRLLPALHPPPHHLRRARRLRPRRDRGGARVPARRTARSATSSSRAAIRSCSPTSGSTRSSRALRGDPARADRCGSRRARPSPARCASTHALATLLRRHAPLFLVTHFNHPKECTAEARAACETLVDRGVPVENQTVLLRRRELLRAASSSI